MFPTVIRIPNARSRNVAEVAHMILVNGLEASLLHKLKHINAKSVRIRCKGLRGGFSVQFVGVELACSSRNLPKQSFIDESPLIETVL